MVTLQYGICPRRDLLMCNISLDNQEEEEEEEEEEEKHFTFISLN